MRQLGPGAMVALLIAVLIRQCLPVEFSYSQSINLPIGWTDFMSFLWIDLKKGDGELLLCSAFFVIWLLGAILLIVRALYLQRKLYNVVTLMEEAPEELLKMCGLTQENLKETKKVKIVMSPINESPYLIGIRKPYIVLPKWNWKQENLTYVIKHELYHLKNHDIIWKQFISFICLLFWWNPFVYLLQRRLFCLIESQNDLRVVTGKTREEKFFYMECLINAVKNTMNFSRSFTLSFGNKHKKELEERLYFIDEGVHRTKQTNILCVTLMAIVFLSTAIVIKPIFPSLPNNEENGIAIDKDNSFLVERDGTYDVYVLIDGKYQYVFNDTERKHFSKNIKVYKKGENIHEKNSDIVDYSSISNRE